MISKLPPLAEALYLTHDVMNLFRELQGQKRLLLRPHGRSGGRRANLVGPFNWRPGAVMRVGIAWMIQGEGEVFLSRAQAAQAVYNGIT